MSVVEWPPTKHLHFNVVSADLQTFDMFGNKHIKGRRWGSYSFGFSNEGWSGLDEEEADGREGEGTLEPG